MDIGDSPINNFSNNYQSGALSFEIISSGKKLITVILVTFVIKNKN